MRVALSIVLAGMAVGVLCEPDPARRPRPQKHPAPIPAFHFIVALESEFLTKERSFWNLEDILRDPFYYLKDDLYFNGDTPDKTSAAAQNNYTISPIFIELPKNGRFSSHLVEGLCGQIKGQRVVGMVLGGHSSDAARAFSVVAKGLGVPVYWVRGESTPFKEIAEGASLEVMLETTARESIEAVRAFMIQVHWHHFTVLADSAAHILLSQGAPERAALGANPLTPHVVLLHTHIEGIFRQLVEMSLSTRGVVVLLCDYPTATRVMREAKRLHLTEGHFVWIWVDTKRTMTDTRLDADYESNTSNNDRLMKHKREIFNYSMEGASHKEKKWSQGSAGFWQQVLKNTDNSTVVVDWEVFDVGLLTLRPVKVDLDKHYVRSGLKVFVNSLRSAVRKYEIFLRRHGVEYSRLGDIGAGGCWDRDNSALFSADRDHFSRLFVRELKSTTISVLGGISHHNFIYPDKLLIANFDILNLINDTYTVRKWRRVGTIRGREVKLNTVIWPGGDVIVSDLYRPKNKLNKFKIVTAIAPPFVMRSAVSDGECVRGVPCYQIRANRKSQLDAILHDIDMQNGDRAALNTDNYTTLCCYGFSVDLLQQMSTDLNFGFHLYLVNDGLFGSRMPQYLDAFRNPFEIRNGVYFQASNGKHLLQNGKYFKRERFRNAEAFIEQPAMPQANWSGIMQALVSGEAHFTVAPLSVTASRSSAIDFTTPYYYSSVSLLTTTKSNSDIPLLAFLLPFSFELWVAIFISLNITAISVAVYEWLSPFGLNPWGRQRTKNFSISSALWVMWGLLCGHLVAFKAPKSWPNKFLINVWGGFSVIFVASYTANIAALIAGLFFQNSNNDHKDSDMLAHRVGVPRASAPESYIRENSQQLWHHVRKYILNDVEQGIAKLQNGTLDILVADTPILDYYRGTDNGCTLKKIGDTLMDHDTYAIGMAKGFPLKDSLSSMISSYSSNGFLDILHHKWFGDLPCFKLDNDIIAQPRPLGVEAVSGVFLLLGLGMFLGVLILIFEHLFYKYTLPILRHKPRDSVWKSRNIMFFSQKLYRFINCVELVSPHHAARELVNTLRQGQITSLFQKSVKRKEHEQRRRRKSKAQFFEMIQEIRRVQQAERKEPPLSFAPSAMSTMTMSSTLPSKKTARSPSLPSISPMPLSALSTLSNKPLPAFDRPVSPPSTFKPALPPKPAGLRRPATGAPPPCPAISTISSDVQQRCSTLNVRRFSSDSLNTRSGTDSIGRRLSREEDLNTSPPDFNSKISLNSYPMANKMETVPKCKARIVYPERSCRSARPLPHRPALTADLYRAHGKPPVPAKEPRDTAHSTHSTHSTHSGPSAAARRRNRSEAAGGGNGQQRSHTSSKRSARAANGNGNGNGHEQRTRSLETPAARPSRQPRRVPVMQHASSDRQVHMFNEFTMARAGQTPLIKLSRSDLVVLLESSDFELRRHLLNALKDKEDIKPP